LNYAEEIRKINSLVEAQDKWRKHECLNMIASENVTSPLVDNAYNNDFSHRYAEGTPGKRYYNGTKYIDELEDYATKLAENLFHARHANLQLVSGTVANIAAFAMFTRPGDMVLTNATTAGGHISHNAWGAAGVLGLNAVSFPITEDGFHIDVDASKKQLENKWSAARSHLTSVMLGCSLFLFPQPVHELSESAHENNIKVVYDAAHVLGLVAGGQFQDPLREGDGADLVTASTHKTFFGPQGGILLTNMPDKEWQRCRGSVFPGVVSNHHLHRIPALAIALLEHEEFGAEYAKQVVKNAKALAQALHDQGFRVCCEQFGFTQSHQVAVDVSELGGGKSVADKLEESNIIVNKNLLPSDKITYSTLQNPSGLRLGVQELTRWGMKEGEMQAVAKLFKKVAVEGKSVKNEVIALRKQFDEVQYTFKPG
jgi:glycine hydroxymethyltransferase